MDSNGNDIKEEEPERPARFALIRSKNLRRRKLYYRIGGLLRKKTKMTNSIWMLNGRFLKSKSEDAVLLNILEMGSFPVNMCILRSLGRGEVSNAFLDHALFLCAQRGHLRAVQLLLRRGAKVRRLGGEGETALTTSVERGFAKIVYTLLRVDKTARRIVATGIKSSGDTPLHLAIGHPGSVHLARLLLSKGAPPNEKNKDGVTPLMKALAWKDVAIVKLLLESGVDADEQNDDGISAREVADRCGVLGILKFLEETKKRSRARRLSALMIAVENENAEILRALLKCRNSDIHFETTAGLLSEIDISNIPSTVKQAAHLSDTLSTEEINSGEISFSREETIFETVKSAPKETALSLAMRLNEDPRPDGSCQEFTELQSRIIEDLIRSGADERRDDQYEKDNPVLRAVRCGSEKLLRILKLDHTSLNSYNMNGRPQTPLMVAAKLGKTRIVRLLLRRGACPNLCVFNANKTALSFALENERIDCAKLLLRRGAMVADPQIEAERAAARGQLEVFKILHENFTLNFQKKSILQVAVMGGQADIVRCVLSGGANVNVKDSSGSPMVMNVESISVLEVMLEFGVDVNAKTDTDPRSLLVKAFYEKNEEMVRLLLVHGADTDDIMSKDTCVIRGQYNISTVSTEMMALLLDHGLDVNVMATFNLFRRQIEDTLLMMATRHCHGGIAKMLIERGADVNMQTSEGRTALIGAINCAHCTKLLLAAGADVNHSDMDGHTALMHAAYSGYDDVMSCLLHAGGMAHLKNSWDETALHFLFLKSRNRSVSVDGALLLLDYGSGIEDVAVNGDTPLIRAARCMSPENIIMLVERGADFNFVNLAHTEATTALSEVFNVFAKDARVRNDDSFKWALDYLLTVGADPMLSPRTELMLHTFILDDLREFIPLVIRSGLPPFRIHVQELLQLTGRERRQWVRYLLLCPEHFLSPFILALFVGNTAVARYLFANRVLTPFDLTIGSQECEVRKHFKNFEMSRTKHFVDNLFSQPFSLKRLSFVAASDTLGSGEVREVKVRTSKFPLPLQNELLFRREIEDMDTTNKKDQDSIAKTVELLA